MEFPHILSPISIGSVRLRNRIFFPPIDVALHRADHIVDRRYIDFLTSLVEKNGIGMIISEFTAVANDQFWAPASRIDKDEFIPGFKDLVRSVHDQGAKIFLQLALLGGRAPSGRAIAPSAIASPLYPGIPEELSREEIRTLVRKWREGAARAKTIGFDGVEVHGGHTYLVGAFMSPHANRREDEYGGDFKGRMRFPCQIIEEIKAECGADYPVGVKFSTYEALENGITGPLSVDIAEYLEKHGADYLHASSSTYMLAGTHYPDVPPLYTPEGPLAEFAGQIKKRTKVPVLTVAGIATPQAAEEILAQGKADMVGVGRAMFADPGWVSKVHAKKAEEITPCIRCNFCHRKIVIQRAGAVECTVNPGLQKEPLKRAAKAKKVIVVGAGPAGLEAALTAAERGHRVTLYEKEKELGGNVRLGCIPSFKKDLERLLAYYGRRLLASSVVFNPGHEVTAAQIRKEGAEVVIVAVGAGDFRPRIPGLTPDAVVTARDFYRKKALHGKSSQRAVVIGGGEVGCEIAWFLAERGRSVSIVDILPRAKWFSDQHPTNRFILMENLADLDVQLLDGAKNIRIAAGKKGPAGNKGRAAAKGGSKSVSLERGDVSYTISAPLIVLATGYLKDERLRAALKGKGGPAVYSIGDCVKPCDIHGAVHEGYAIGAQI